MQCARGAAPSQPWLMLWKGAQLSSVWRPSITSGVRSPAVILRICGCEACVRFSKACAEDPSATVQITLAADHLGLPPPYTHRQRTLSLSWTIDSVPCAQQLPL